MGRLVGSPWPAGAEQPAEDGEMFPALTAIGEIRSLAQPEAARGLPARVRGVVTYLDRNSGRFFMQDGQAAIGVDMGGVMTVFRPGELVEVSGNSMLIEGAPGLFTRRIRRLGSGGLPTAKEIQTSAMRNPEMSGLYVSVRGRVREEALDRETRRLVVESEDGLRFEAVAPTVTSGAPTESFINSMVGVVGICLADGGNGMPRVLMSSADRIEALESMPTDLFELPLTSLGSLGEPDASRLAHTRGIVTQVIPGEQLIIQDGERGLVAELETEAMYVVGDRVALVGSLIERRGMPEFRALVSRKIGEAAEPAAYIPAPEELTVERLAKGELHGRLIQLEGMALGRGMSPAGGSLLLRAGEAEFLISNPALADELAAAAPGAKLVVTGACRVEVSRSGELRRLLIIPRSGRDLQVVKDPKFWTRARIVGAVAILGFAFASGAIWVTMLRRRVLQQTGLIRRQLEKEERFAKLALELGDALGEVEAAELIADAAQDMIGWDAFIVDLYDADSRTIMELIAFDTIDGEVRRTETASRPLKFSDVTRRVVEGESSELIRRTPGGKECSDLVPFGDKDRRSAVLLYAPLKSKGRVIGILSAQSYDPKAFDELDLKTLTELARGCGDAFERIGVNAALRASETRFRTVAETLTEGLVITDREGRVLYLNSKMMEMTGRSPDEALGMLHYEVFQDEEDWGRARERKRHRNEGQTESCEIRLRRKDGTRFWASINATPFRDPDGVIIGSLGCYEDIEGRKQTEEQLRRTHKMEAVGQLSAGIAHDFNNILTIIGGHTGILLRRAEEDSREMRALEQIANASDRAAELTSKLLAFSRKQHAEAKPIDLRREVEDSAAMIRSALGETVAMRMELEEELPPALADAGMIGQVLTNLAVNSRDAMPDGGEFVLRLSLRSVSAEGEVPEGARPGNYLCLEAEDTGEGIAAEFRDRIFEPFFSTKAAGKGTGLGLASVFGIVQQHEGWVEVDSIPGEGTTFRVMIPAADEIAPDVPWGDELPVTRAHGETILLVEDETSLLTLNKTVLEDCGYRVLEASTGVAAREMWDQHKTDIDLLLTDVVMPGGMNGCELAKGILAERPDLPVVFVSGYNKDVLDGSLKIEYGFNFLAKPFRPNDLLKTVDQRLAAS